MATNPHLIVCNGSPTKAKRPKEWSAVEPQSLSTIKPHENVMLEIGDLTDRMVEELPAVIQDLIELAALIYAADQSSKRVGGKTLDWGAK